MAHMDCIKALGELSRKPGDYTDFAARALSVLRGHDCLSGACLFEVLPGGGLAESATAGGLSASTVEALAKSCMSPKMPQLQYGKKGTPLLPITRGKLSALPVGDDETLSSVLVVATGSEARIAEQPVIAVLCKFLHEAHTQTRCSQLASLHNSMLATLGGKASQRDALNELARCLEAAVPGSLCSIMVFRAGTLHLAAAPSAPAGVVKTFREFAARDGAGSCASATLSGEAQFVSDTLADPRWRDVREVAKQFAINACWSVPVKGADGKSAIGTLALSNRQVAYPDNFQQQLLREASQWVALILRQSATKTRLRELEAAYESTVDGAAEAIFTLDPGTGCFVDCNRRAREIFGLDADAIGTLGIADISPGHQPDGRPSGAASKSNLERAAADEVLRYEWMHLGVGGREFPAEVFMAPVTLGERHLIRASIFDISVRRREEETRRRLELIVESTSDLVGSADPEQKIIYMNSSGRRMLGLRADESPVGQPIANFHDSKAMQILDQVAIPHALENGVWRGELSIRQASGKLIPLSVVLLANRGRDGSLEFLSMVARDISVSRRNQQALILERQRFQTLFDDNPLTLLMVNEAGRILEANRFGLEQLRYDRDLVANAPISGLVAPSRAPELERQLAACFAEPDEVHHWEEEFVNLGGKVLWMRVSARVLPGDGAHRLLLACEDFSEAHRLSEELTF